MHPVRVAFVLPFSPRAPRLCRQGKMPSPIPTSSQSVIFGLGISFNLSRRDDCTLPRKASEQY